MKRAVTVLFFLAMMLAFVSNAVQAAAVERFNPALLAGEHPIHDFSVQIEVDNNHRMVVRDHLTTTWRFPGDSVTPQEMIQRFQERNPRAEIVGVDLDQIGHYRYFHIYYIFKPATRYAE